MKRQIIDEAGIGALVAGFYGRAREDALIGPVFAAAVDDWDAHIARLTDFWSSVTLSTGRYKGNPFGAHRPLPLQPAMFDRWLELWRETAREVFTAPVAEAFIRKAELIAGSLTMGLFGLAETKAGQAPEGR
jgi:hemoglobin